MRLPITTGRVYVHQLLDIVGASETAAQASEEVRHLYDWHNGRGLAGMQLTFAPTAGAVLAIVAKPSSTAVVIVAAALFGVALVLGVLQLLALNWQAGEYVLAIGLVAELHRFRPDLAGHPDGIGADPGSATDSLYGDEIGSISMVAYKADREIRKTVLSALSELRKSPTEAATGDAANRYGRRFESG